MPELLRISTPEFSEILTQVKRGMTAAYSGFLTRSNRVLSAFTNNNLLYPLSNIVARRDEFAYSLARDAATQAFPGGATGGPLQQWASLVKVLFPVPATTQLTIAVTGRNNFSLPAGSFIAGIGTAKRYTTDAPIAFGAPETTIEVNITAENPGSDYNLSIGDETAVESISDDVDVVAPVTALLVAGADPLSDEQTSVRVQAAFASRGACRLEAYYIEQLRNLDASIGEVFVDPAGLGSGTVAMYPLLILSSDQALNSPWSINLPSQGQVDGWEISMNDRTVRGVNDDVDVRIIAVPWAKMTMTLTPNSADTQKAAENALRSRVAEGRGASGYTIANSELVGAVSNAQGIDSVVFNDIQPSIIVDHEATIDNIINPGASADIAALNGQLIEPEFPIVFL